MPSVTQRIKQIKQPYGGYLRPSSFRVIQLSIDDELCDSENIHSSLVGLAVDYLTRYVLGANKKNAFSISLRGASIIGRSILARYYLSRIKGLDDKSIRYVCKLVGFDVCYRAGPLGYRSTRRINPDKDTINNIRIMVMRSLSFFEKYGPVTLEGFTFEGAYTKKITSGDGDFLTRDTLWDFKVSINSPTKDHTLQLLIYYLMGSVSYNKKYFSLITKLGVFNPRLNRIYLLDISDIPAKVINDVIHKVIL